MDVARVKEMCKHRMIWALIWLFASMIAQAENEERICNSLDVRNKVENFEQLRDCTVIEGNLQILLIDHAEPSDYDDLHFPKLREITGYFLLFRVSNLRTLSHIFPNLAVIRGDTLFTNYALVVYEMLELQEIGLPSLVNITRGAVRIEKNPIMCYLDMIDWSLILHEGVEGNFIVDNKDQEDCLNFCPEDRHGARPCRRHGAAQELCWTSDHCQIVCPVNCPSACYKDSTTCCHEQCIGGCDGPTASDCVACQSLVFNGTCMDQCPAGTYSYLDRRCILAKDCPANWTLFKGTCSETCPVGFTKNASNKRECQLCDGPCPKVCEGGEINSVAAAAKYVGCTKMIGSLFISIHGASESNIMKELEESLGMLEEITGALVVRKAASLISLNFLKQLRIIGGQYLQNGNYAVYVMDNRNLQQLFHWDSHPEITIGNGKLFFHFNPKLCMSEINQLNARTGRNNSFDHTDINPSTNGDQVACSTDRLLVSTVEMPTMVMLRWNTNDIELGDPRNLLGFIIQWKESAKQNVMEFDGEDACGSSSWESMFVSPAEESEQSVMVIVPGLTPYTQYAFLVRSYTISSTNYGAKSDIMYIRTTEDKPSTPMDLVVYSNSHTNLTVSWKPPKYPNGIVTHYIVSWQKQHLDKEQFIKRDFCREKPPTLKKSGRVEDVNQQEEEINSTLQEIAGCCGCPKDAEELRKEQEEARSQREFENELHNTVYVKRPDARRRRRRNVPDEENTKDGGPPGKATGNYTIISLPPANTTQAPLMNTTAPISNPIYKEYVNVTKPDDVALIELTNLEHFEEYLIEVYACNNVGCGERTVIFGRTIPKPEADEITEVDVSMNTLEPTDRRVLITWSEPPNPNGVVIIYEIEYAKIDSTYEVKEETTSEPAMLDGDDTSGSGMSPLEKIECINPNEYQRIKGYELVNVEPGNYSARVRAISLAGSGPRTSARVFQVPDVRIEPTPMPASGMGPMGATIAVCVALVFVLVFLLVVFLRWQYKRDHMPDGVLYASVNPEYMSTNDMYVADEWEFPRDHLEIIHELGKGSFGMVYEGLAKGILPEETISKVAVKSVQANASIRDRIEFLNEASVMKAINAHHVVRLLGVVSKGQPTYVIMEFMAQGDLKNWLRARRPEDQAELPLSERKLPPTLEEIVNMAAEVADGMAYLAAHKYVHRDLSARNCLVSEEGTCKVADFGLARDIYQSDYYRKERGGMLPIRWMAPESIKDGVFHCSSDVWSYGILLWEIATLGELPYQGYSNEEAGEYIKSGRILPRREGTPDNLHELMMQCWQYNDKMRPTFFDILHTLESTGMLLPDFSKLSFYHSEERQPPDQHETLMPTELEKVSMFNVEDEEDDEDDEDEDKVSRGSRDCSAARCATPRKEGRDAPLAMNGYVSMPVNGNANGPVGKVTEC